MEARFRLGKTVITPGALRCFVEAEENPATFLHRHVTGDGGEVDEADKQENELSVKEGFRILSAYTLKSGVKVWVISESDRSLTKILLPEEY
jgi:hypothetical protein